MVVGRTVNVGTTPTDLLAGLGVEGEYVLRVRLGNAQCWVGDSTVAVSDGYLVSGAGTVQEFRFQAGDRSYWITPGSPQAVDILVYSV